MREPDSTSNKGYTIPIIFSTITIIASGVTAFFIPQLKAQSETAAVSERVARLEVAVPIIKDDIKDIKASVKEIANSLKNN